MANSSGTSRTRAAEIARVAAPAQSAAVTASSFRLARRPSPRLLDRRPKHRLGVDMAQDYQAVNGVAGHGGSIDGSGPVVVGGMLYVNSGCAIFGGVPGNVLPRSPSTGSDPRLLYRSVDEQGARRGGRLRQTGPKTGVKTNASVWYTEPFLGRLRQDPGLVR
jgi:hypothetical protein